MKNHPVLRQLLELRFAMEKLRPVDAKLKPQIERLLHLASMTNSQEKTLAMKKYSVRPNLAAMLEDDSEEAPSDMEQEEDEALDEEEDEDDDSERDTEQQAVYRPPKLTSTMYVENEKAAQKTEDKMEKQRRKLRNSAILESLREEFSNAPEVSDRCCVSARFIVWCRMWLLRGCWARPPSKSVWRRTLKNDANLRKIGLFDW